MDILELARESGMLVLLDGRIGRQEYHSVHGSLQTLQRFAEAVLTASNDFSSGAETVLAVTA